MLACMQGAGDAGGGGGGAAFPSEAYEECVRVCKGEIASQRSDEVSETGGKAWESPAAVTADVTPGVTQKGDCWRMLDILVPFHFSSSPYGTFLLDGPS